MKNWFTIGLVALGLKSADSYATDKSFFDLKVKTLMGEDADLNQYKGKVIMVVNVASKCGYTPQYKGLEQIYQDYKDKGFVVLGFPSNEFGGQEPGSPKEIKEFCALNFGVTFPLFQKGSVKGKDKQPVYKFLTEDGNKAIQGEVLWNFEKFLINKKGELVERYRS
ncbi:MAG: glutathione peroxidase, partial [Pseudobdellovibrionaceae bacterium]